MSHEMERIQRLATIPLLSSFLLYNLIARKVCLHFTLLFHSQFIQAYPLNYWKHFFCLIWMITGVGIFFHCSCTRIDKHEWERISIPHLHALDFKRLNWKLGFHFCEGWTFMKTEWFFSNYVTVGLCSVCGLCA